MTDKDELSSIEEWLREQNERVRKKLRREGFYDLF